MNNMRLIDADVFKEEVGTETKLRRTICKVINEQPTAYNIDAVVAELEDKKKFWEDSYDYQIGKEKSRSYEHAIEIVRKGGVHE